MPPDCFVALDTYEVYYASFIYHFGINTELCA